MARIGLSGIGKRFGKYAALRDLDLEIRDGEFLILLGPSGCGKTTTLRCIAGLEKVDTGDLRIGNRRVNNLSPSQRDVAFVFQMYALYPHFTVFENIAFPLRNQGVREGDLRARVMEVAEILRIRDLLNTHPTSLSGGGRQKVALARAMVRRPQAFLMDEPLGSLDAKFRERMRVEIKKLQMRLGATTVYVTHDQLEAMSMGDRIAVMHQGVLQQVAGPHELYDRPANTFVATFMGAPAMNLCAGRLDRENGKLRVALGSQAWTLPDPLAAFLERSAGGIADILLGVRPENLILEPPGPGGLQATVIASEALGPFNLVLADLEGMPIRVRISRLLSPQPGEIFGLRPAPGKVRFFDAESGKALELPPELEREA